MNKFSPFEIFPEFEQSYKRIIDQGIKYLQNKKIIVTGLVRDAEKYLISSVEQLLFLEKTCQSVSYFFYENDSIDQTPSILESISNTKSNFKFLSEQLDLPKFGSVKKIERTMNLSKARNKCLEYIKKTYDDYDYIIVLDLDYDYIDPYGVLNSFGHFSYHNIDGICGNTYQLKELGKKGGKKYVWNYDSWAFRLNHWAYLGSNSTIYNADPMLWFGMWRLPIGSEIIPIYSGFGGCCIYKLKKYIEGKYSGEDCEHVTFHKSLNENEPFNLYINPSQYLIS